MRLPPADLTRRRSTIALLSGLLVLLLSAAGCAGSTAGQAAGTSRAPAASAPAPAQSAAPAAPPSAAATAPPLAGSPAGEPELVQVAHLANPSDVYFYLASEKGYFREQGIEIELHLFDTGAQIIAPMSAGQLDVGRGTISAGLFNAFGRGLPIRIVASQSRIIPGTNHFALVIRSDLAGQIQSYADLRGRVLAYPGESSGNEVALDRALQKGNLSLADVQTVTLGFPDILSGLGNRALDGGLLVEPLITFGQQRGVLERWKDASDFTLGQEVAVLMYAPRFMEMRPDTARRFMLAYLQGVREYYEAFFGNKQQQDEVIAVLTQYTSIKDPSVFKQMAPHGVDPNGRVNVESLRADQDWFVAHGKQQAPASMDQVVDHQYVNAALEVLGVRD